MRRRTSTPPAGWEREVARVPYQLAELSGDLSLRPDAWSLDFYRAITPPVRQPEAISLTAHLPPDGRLEL